MKEIIKSNKKKLDNPSGDSESLVAEMVEVLFKNKKVTAIARELNEQYTMHTAEGSREEIASHAFFIFENIAHQRVIFESNGKSGFGCSIEQRKEVSKSKPEKTSLTKEDAGIVLRIFSSIEQIVDSILVVNMGSYSAKKSNPKLSIDICDLLSFEQKIRMLRRYKFISKDEIKVLNKIREFRNNVAHSSNTLQVSYRGSFKDIMHRFTADVHIIKEYLLKVYDESQDLVIDYLYELRKK